jgi:hypothetical protein
MPLKGFIDRQAGRDRLRKSMLERHGKKFVPEGGWDAFFGPDDPICDVQCQQCHKMVPEVRPFGPNHESICEACAKLDMKTTRERLRGLGIV